ncbi:Solute carrier family 23 member 2 [Zea mays]|uniref:Solute carrier family 23 member 2 n=1 Tax=Zea mays TaxID=4577 RepID=A0A1D6GB39_MAIZE|nr:Solute carrier family 23 member 2 [Zea mays]
MAEVKPEEISHPPMEQLQGFEYCIDSNPPWGEAIILGFQHYILALGTAVMIPTVLVPMMGGDDGDRVRVVQTLLFVTGINTLLQSLFGTRLPTVIGGSYAFVIPIMAIIQDPSLSGIPDGHERFLETMKAIQGALIVSSSIQIILGYSQLWGIFSRSLSFTLRSFLPRAIPNLPIYYQVVPFFSPVGMTPVVALLGFGLFERGFPVVGRCVEIGLPMLILFVVLSQYLKNIQIKEIPILERFSLFICVALVWAYAQILTSGGAYKNSAEVTQNNCRTDRANLISSAPWIKIPYPLQWGAPTFNAGQSFGIVSAVLVSLVESTASYKAAARLASATPPPAHILSRGIGWQGIGILLDGLFGTGTGSTVSVENVGLLGSTRIGSRRVIQISAGFMIFFSMLGEQNMSLLRAKGGGRLLTPLHFILSVAGKFGALFASIPFTIFAAVYCVLFGLVAAVGLSFLQFTNMNSMRNLFIVGVSIFLGLSVPEYFFRYTMAAHRGPAHTKAGWFNDYINTIFSSPPTVGLMVAVFLDNTLEVKQAGMDRGMPWWQRFRTFKGDSRNEEFYRLPFNLNRFFPPA